MQHMLVLHRLLRTQLQLSDDGEKKTVLGEMRGLGHCACCVRDLHGHSAKTALER